MKELDKNMLAPLVMAVLAAAATQTTTTSAEAQTGTFSGINRLDPDHIRHLPPIRVRPIFDQQWTEVGFEEIVPFLEFDQKNVSPGNINWWLP